MAHVRQTKRRFFTGIFALAMVPLLAASAAYACQRLATLHANPTSAGQGTQVQVQGANYSKTAGSSNVDIRLDGRNGPVLATIAPASLEGSGNTGKFSVTVTVPANTAIGNHILVATQTLSGGEPCIGCPGRANLEVRAAAASSSSGTAAAPAQNQTSDASASSAQSESSNTSAASSEPAAPSQAQAQTSAGDPAGNS
ncbi:MAG: hypothetical protein M3P34_06615, partial [Actinomycetota bacterium]|nr:hypothetical protein [Actinomycetota bacterium]